MATSSWQLLAGTACAAVLVATVLVARRRRAQALRVTLADVDVCFIRHGNTNKAPVDFDRTLTPKGEAQAAAARAYLSQMPLLKAIAVSSPATRCVQTASIALAGQGVRTVQPAQKIYDALLQPSSEAFGRLGYAPLRSYRAEGAEMTALLDNYAIGVLDQVAELLDGVDVASDDVQQRPTLVIFGHAVYLPAVALLLAQRRGHSDAELDKVLRTNTKEACGFWVRSHGVEIMEHELA